MYCWKKIILRTVSRICLLFRKHCTRLLCSQLNVARGLASGRPFGWPSPSYDLSCLSQFISVLCWDKHLSESFLHAPTGLSPKPASAAACQMRSLITRLDSRTGPAILPAPTPIPNAHTIHSPDRNFWTSEWQRAVFGSTCSAALCHGKMSRFPLKPVF